MKPAPASLSHRLTSPRILAATFLLLMSAICAPIHAQDIAGGSSGPAISRFDLTGQYGYLKPFDSGINSIPFSTYPAGAVGSVAFYFKPHFGIQLEGNYFPNEPNDNDCVYTAQAGPIFRFQKRRFIPFVHVLAGAAEVGGPAGQPCSTWGYGGTAGGGLDYVLPIFHNHLALRLFQVDMTYSHVVNPEPAKPSQYYGGVADLYAVRASAGLTLRFGDMHPAGQAVPMLACSADPGNPFAGDPVAITSSLANVNPKSAKDLAYVWETSAGKIASNGASAAVDTTGLAPGSYTVSGHVMDGPKKREIASCTASFTIRVIEPPTVTCGADRSAIYSGDPVAITAKGISSQNRPLTYSFTTTGGAVAANTNGSTATLVTVGVPPGNIAVTCKVTDDRNQSATASASVVVATPAPPPPAVVAAAQAQSLCSISFDRDPKRPNRVNNEAKGCLDDIALALSRSTDAKLLIIGNHAPNESNQTAAERAMNAAQYLTDEKGIDGSRLDLRIGSEGARTVSTMLVPPGATVDIGTTTSFDTSSVKRTGQPYGRPRTTPAPIHKRKPIKKPTTPPPSPS
jgi:hypothetical protein